MVLSQPVGADNPAALRTSITTNSNILDNAVTFASNVFASLSVSLAGRLLRGTDTKRWYVDSGTSLDTLMHLGFGPLALGASSASHTASLGELAVMNPSSTLTLPTPTATNQFIGIVAASTVTGATPVTVSGGTSTIYGPGYSGTSFLLGTGASYAVLQSISTNQWVTVAGQQDTGWVSLGLTAGWSAIGGNIVPAYRVLGDRAWLKGTPTNTTGGASSSPFTTFPALIRPVALANVLASTGPTVLANFLNIAATGTATLGQAAPNGESVGFDGASYSLAA